MLFIMRMPSTSNYSRMGRNKLNGIVSSLHWPWWSCLKMYGEFPQHLLCPPHNYWISVVIFISSSCCKENRIWLSIPGNQTGSEQEVHIMIMVVSLEIWFHFTWVIAVDNHSAHFWLSCIEGPVLIYLAFTTFTVLCPDQRSQEERVWWNKPESLACRSVEFIA